MNVTPAYSHGGSSSSWPAVAGTAIGAGNPISLLSGQGVGDCVFHCFNRGTAAVTFVVEESGGALNSTTGLPPTNSWEIIPLTWTQQTITLAAGDSASLPIGSRGPWLRTRITAINTGGQLESFVSLLQLTKIVVPVSAQNPIKANVATEGQ